MGRKSMVFTVKIAHWVMFKEHCSFCYPWFNSQVLALPELLDVAERVDWRKCPETDEQENEVANEIRSSFMPYEEKLGEDVDPEFG